MFHSALCLGSASPCVHQCDHRGGFPLRMVRQVRVGWTLGGWWELALVSYGVPLPVVRIASAICVSS